MEIIYRQYEDSDTTDLLSLMVELGYLIPPEEFQETIKEIQKRKGAIFVAEAENSVIGSSSVLIDVRLAEGISGEIASLVVSKDFRGLGIGKNLVQIAEEHLSERVGSIRIRANVIREKAHNYYKSLGYQEVKEQKIFTKSLN